METITNNDEQLLTNDDLKAIEMRFDGYTMREIGEEIGVSHGQVRQMFMITGKLHNEYKKYAKEQSEERRAQAQDTFKAHLNNAVRTLAHIMAHSKIDIARIAAAKEIINRQLGETVKVILNTDQTKVNDYLEAAKQLSNENISGDEPRGENIDAVQS